MKSILYSVWEFLRFVELHAVVTALNITENNIINSHAQDKPALQKFSLKYTPGTGHTHDDLTSTYANTPKVIAVLMSRL